MNIVIAISDPLLLDVVSAFIKNEKFSIVAQIIDPNKLGSLIDFHRPDILILSTDFADHLEEDKLLEVMTQYPLPTVLIDKSDSRDHYIMSERLKHCFYLVFPFTAYTLESILHNIADDLSEVYSSNYLYNKYIFIKANNTFQKINLDNIDYLNSEGNYTNLYVGEEKYTIKYSLSRLLEKSNFSSFIRVHRNYAVHKYDIAKIDFAERFLIARGNKIPFGRTYTKQIRAVMNLIG
ncbi:MAG: LytTR family transcriptional regulator [Saprospiraceae bacterium]|nr:LytTR family transcriptional regulator [Saprospiraceae bacterium]